MSGPDKHDWKPDPQLLAAFFDGELEGRDDLDDLRTRVEGWLQHNPEAAGPCAEQRKLVELWRDTAPREPNAETWKRVLVNIQSEHNKPTCAPTSRRAWLTASVIAASVTLLLGLAFGGVRYTFSLNKKDLSVVKAPNDKTNHAEDVEVFPVATNDEVMVTLIEGADTHAVMVGELPVSEPLLLAETGDVRVFAVHSEASNKMRPQIEQDGPRRPMIWIPIETD